MKPALLFRRGLRGFEPANTFADDAFHKVALGDTVKVEIKRPRSLQWHRRYWALISLIADNTTYSADEVHALIKLRCGCAKVIEERDGNVIRIPDSIAFDKMDGVAWGQFWERVVAYVCADLLPGVTSDVLAQEISELAGVA